MQKYNVGTLKCPYFKKYGNYHSREVIIKGESLIVKHQALEQASVAF
jgi:hypothetical protein